MGCFEPTKEVYGVSPCIPEDAKTSCSDDLGESEVITEKDEVKEIDE